MYKELLKTNDSVQIYSIHAWATEHSINVEKLPYTTKILLESLMRNQHKLMLQPAQFTQLLLDVAANNRIDVPIIPTRVIMQDASGVPALVDLVSLRQQLVAQGVDPLTIQPEIPVDLVIDHSVQVDHYRTATAFVQNLELEYSRNEERYAFLKWAQHAFEHLSVVPPANGIIHQVNLEYLTKVIDEKVEVGTTTLFPELVIGTDSHTTMVNALGVLGWGVGGIEAEAAMLGVPVSMALPEVIGVNIRGKLAEGVTATDVALTLTQCLREHNVVGKFVEFFGQGLQQLALPDRATIANMAPEYGATCGFFPVDEITLKFLKLTGKTANDVQRVEAYCREQGLFYDANARRTDATYTQVLRFDLSEVEVSVAGPKRPQDRIALANVKQSFPKELPQERALQHEIVDGSIVIAAITSCTNTSNPVNMIGAGLLAKKAVENGLAVSPTIQTSLAPGSKAVTGYLQKAGLLPYLEHLGFYVTGYGCSACVGNTGPLNVEVEQKIQQQDLTVAAVLSGNRNFEGRIHALVKANYLASPPLVIAYALAGTMNIDLTCDPIGYSTEGKAVYLKDIWPSSEEISQLMTATISSDLFVEAYRHIFTGDESWRKLPYKNQPLFDWDEHSTYFKASPFFEATSDTPGKINEARVLLMLGDSITTDHISPVGSIPKQTIAAQYLRELGVEEKDFNTYGARRGNDEVLVRGTFAHIRLQNALATQTGGYTRYLPSGQEMDIYSASQLYKDEQTPLIILAGKEYGTGSARDWAAKGTYLLGVKVVIAESFERIHRSNLAMMGIVPLQFMPGESIATLQLTGEERYTFYGLDGDLTPRQPITAQVESADGIRTIQTVLRLDTQIELNLYRQKGIFQSIMQKRTANVQSK